MWAWFTIKVRSRSSALHERTHRSMIAFMRGTRIPVFTVAMSSSSKTALKAAVYLLSRSRIRYFTVALASWRSMTRLRASCAVQAAVGGRWRREHERAGGVLDDSEDVQPRAG